MTARTVSRFMQFAYLALLAMFIATPMLVIIVFSFDANRFPSIPWGGFSLQWYKAILEDDMVKDAFTNSFIVGLGTATVATAIGFAAAYLDFQYDFWAKRLAFLAIAVPPAVPSTVLGMAMLALLSRIGFFGRLETIIACHVVIAASFAMALIRLRLNDFDKDMEKAAWNLGATRAASIIKIIIPFCKSALISAFFLSAAVSFDEFMIAWFVGGVNETVPVRILNLLQGQVNPKINAIGTVVLLISISLVLVSLWFTRSEIQRGNSAAEVES